ncbi:hypothetical protein Tco_1164906 [Tanacetum coccineum]
MMFSPNHPTSNVEDAFSSNIPNYLLASPDYFPTSPGNTYSSSSNLFGVVPIASPTLSLFHDDPYMKVLQAFYAKNHLSHLQLSYLNHQCLILKNSFFLRNYYHQRNEEQIEEILNHLDELSLDRIEHIEDKIEGLGKGWAAIKKLVADSVTTALKEQAATMASISNPNRNIGPTRTPITKMRNYKEFINCHPFYFNENKVAFATGTLTDDALSGGMAYTKPDGKELSTTTPTIATTTTSVTPTPTTINNSPFHNRTKDKKLSKLMMPLQLRNREFPKVFPEDLLGLPTVSQVEFQIDLIPGVAPVARAPYRLAPTEMHELSNQLQKLAD